MFPTRVLLRSLSSPSPSSGSVSPPLSQLDTRPSPPSPADRSAQVATFTADEMRRYEAYRRSDLKKERVKKVLTGISPVFDKMAPSDAYIIAVKGLAKLFVGDVVETAATVAAEWGDRKEGDTGLNAPPLQTKHLRVRFGGPRPLALCLGVMLVLGCGGGGGGEWSERPAQQVAARLQ